MLALSRVERYISQENQLFQLCLVACFLPRFNITKLRTLYTTTKGILTGYWNFFKYRATLVVKTYFIRNDSTGYSRQKKWAILEKTQKGGGGGVDNTFLNPSTPPPQEFFIFYFYPGNSPDKAKLNPWIFHKIVLPLGNSQGQKQRALARNSTLFFLGQPWKFHLLFLWYPWKFHILINPSPPPHLDFFWNSPMLLCLVKTQCMHFLLCWGRGDTIPT